MVGVSHETPLCLTQVADPDSLDPFKVVVVNTSPVFEMLVAFAASPHGLARREHNLMKTKTAKQHEMRKSR